MLPLNLPNNSPIAANDMPPLPAPNPMVLDEAAAPPVAKKAKGESKVQFAMMTTQVARGNEDGGWLSFERYFNPDGSLNAEWYEKYGQHPHPVVRVLEHTGFFKDHCIEARGQWELGDENQQLHYQWTFKFGVKDGQTNAMRISASSIYKLMSEYAMPIVGRDEDYGPWMEDVFPHGFLGHIDDGAKLHRPSYQNCHNYCSYDFYPIPWAPKPPLAGTRKRLANTTPWKFMADGHNGRVVVTEKITRTQAIRAALQKGEKFIDILDRHDVNLVNCIKTYRNEYALSKIPDCKYKCGNPLCGSAPSFRDDPELLDRWVRRDLSVSSDVVLDRDSEQYVEAAYFYTHPCPFENVWFFGIGGGGKTNIGARLAAGHCILRSEKPDNVHKIECKNGFFGDKDTDLIPLSTAKVLIWNEVTAQGFGGINKFKQVFECTTDAVNLKFGNVKLHNDLNIITSNPCPLVVFEGCYADKETPTEEEFVAWTRRLNYVFFVRKPNATDTNYYRLHNLPLPWKIVIRASFPTWEEFLTVWVARKRGTFVLSPPAYVYKLEENESAMYQWTTYSAQRLKLITDWEFDHTEKRANMPVFVPPPVV